MQLLLPVAIAVAVVGGGIALHESGLIQDWQAHLAMPDEFPSQQCHETALVPFVPTPSVETRRVEFVIDNQASQDVGIVCLYDEQLVKRFHKELEIPARTVVRHAFDVPATWLFAQTVLGEPVAERGEEGSWTAGGNWVNPCEGGTTEIPTTNRFEGTARHAVGQAARCASVQMSVDGKVFLPTPGEPPKNGALAATAVAGGGLAVAVLAWGRRLGWFAFFSRLQRSTVLDHERRSRILELVEADPGVHLSEIGSTLELSPGVAAYHLRVLTRERILTAVGLPGSRHYFSFGKFSPARMRAMAVARRPVVRRVVTALQASPHASLSSLAVVTGYSVARLSRLARRLEAAGLVRRRNDGRRVVLEALPLPP